MMVNIGAITEYYLSKSFHRYGEIIGHHPHIFLILPLLLSLSLIGPALLNAGIDNNVEKLFVPWDALAVQEQQTAINYQKRPQNLEAILNHKEIIKGVSSNLFLFGDTIVTSKRLRQPRASAADGDNETEYEFEDVKIVRRYNYRKLYQVYIIAQNESNILTGNSLKAIDAILKQFRNFTMKFRNQEIRYDGDLCVTPCLNINQWISKARTVFTEANFRRNPNVQLNYPRIKLLDQEYPVDKLMFGVEVEGVQKELVGAKVLLAAFEVAFQKNKFLLAAEKQFIHEFHKHWNSLEGVHGLRFIPNDMESLEREMLEIILSILPFISVTVFGLLLFVTLSNMSSKPQRSKPIEGFCSVISVVLSIICSFGVFFSLQFKLNPVAVVSPFLVMAIGVDDAFLILSAWRSTPTCLPVPKRMALTMEESGTSLIITTVTDGLSFVLGYYLCLTPAVSTFCLITAISVFFDFFFQITFFVSIVVFGGRREEQNRSLCCSTNICGFREEETLSEKKFSGKPEGSIPNRFLRNKYAIWLSNQRVKVIGIISYCVYIVIALFGCATIETDMSVTKFVTDHSSLVPYFKIADKYIWGDTVEARIVINDPPDLRIWNERHKLGELLEIMEYSPHSVGPESTEFWLRDYLKYVQLFDVNLQQHFYNKTLMHAFLTSPDGQKHQNAIKFRLGTKANEPDLIYAFQMTTHFFGLHKWSDRTTNLALWRSLSDKYAYLKPTIFHGTSLFVDQKEAIPASATQTIGAALLAMIIIVGLSVPHVSSIFYVTFTLLSTSAGVIGGLNYLGGDIGKFNCSQVLRLRDHVSLGCILMAIGFAVDFTSHICIKFQRLNIDIPPNLRLQETLGSVGWPVIQAMISSLAAIFVLIFVPAYMTRVYFTCAMLVLVFGGIHALFFLPIIQIIMIPQYQMLKKTR